MTRWPFVQQIYATDVEAFFAGAQLFTSGGSAVGPSGVPIAWVHDVLSEYGPVKLLPAGEAPADGWAAAVGFVGAPFLLDEQVPTGEEIRRAVGALQRWAGRRLTAVVALNCAGVNALAPLIAAAQLDLPLLDVDGMGRVFPLVEQTTFTLAGLPATPLAVAGSGGEDAVFDCPTRRLEVLLRQTVLTCGGWVACAGYLARPSDLAAGGIPGGISQVLGVGRLLHDGSDGRTVAERLGGRLLGRGRVIDVERRTARWGARSLPAAASSIVLREESGQVLRLEVHNEVLLALADGVAVATVPDVIGLLSVPDQQVLGVEEATVGSEVDVVSSPAAPAWRTERGLALAGPGAFGLPDLVQGDG